jgi:hypothetical protein
MPLANWLVLAGIVALLVCILRMERRTLEGSAFLYLRALWPSFRFFEAIEPPPRLEHRTVGSDGSFGAWHITLHAPRRRIHHIVANPAGNLHLFHASLVEQLALDLDREGAEAVMRLTSFRLVSQLVRTELRVADASAMFQFRLLAADDHSEAFVSPVLGSDP